jgi:hypothetical protein
VLTLLAVFARTPACGSFLRPAWHSMRAGGTDATSDAGSKFDLCAEAAFLSLPLLGAAQPQGVRQAAGRLLAALVLLERDNAEPRTTKSNSDSEVDASPSAPTGCATQLLWALYSAAEGPRSARLAPRLGIFVACAEVECAPAAGRQRFLVCCSSVHVKRAVVADIALHTPPVASLPGSQPVVLGPPHADAADVSGCMPAPLPGAGALFDALLACETALAGVALALGV